MNNWGRNKWRERPQEGLGTHRASEPGVAPATCAPWPRAKAPRPIEHLDKPKGFAHGPRWRRGCSAGGEARQWRPLHEMWI